MIETVFFALKVAICWLSGYFIGKGLEQHRNKVGEVIYTAAVPAYEQHVMRDSAGALACSFAEDVVVTVRAWVPER